MMQRLIISYILTSYNTVWSYKGIVYVISIFQARRTVSQLLCLTTRVPPYILLSFSSFSNLLVVQFGSQGLCVFVELPIISDRHSSRSLVYVGDLAV